MTNSVLSTCNKFGVDVGVESAVAYKLIMGLFDGAIATVSAATAQSVIYKVTHINWIN